jgi:Secretion system C-terminal sorting domain
MKKWITYSCILLLTACRQQAMAGIQVPLNAAIATITITDSCPPHFTIRQLGDFSFHADKRSVLKTLSASIDGNMQLQAGYRIEISAQQEIHFLPGFSTAPGSTLHAWIAPAPCTGAAIKSAAEPGKEISGLAIVYPNPTKGEFVIVVPPRLAAGKYDITVYGTDGRVLEERKAQSGTRISFNLSAKSRGIYLVKLQSSTAVLAQNFKVVVQ